MKKVLYLSLVVLGLSFSQCTPDVSPEEMESIDTTLIQKTWVSEEEDNFETAMDFSNLKPGYYIYAMRVGDMADLFEDLGAKPEDYWYSSNALVKIKDIKFSDAKSGVIYLEGHDKFNIFFEELSDTSVRIGYLDANGNKIDVSGKNAEKGALWTLLKEGRVLDIEAGV